MSDLTEVSVSPVMEPRIDQPWTQQIEEHLASVQANCEQQSQWHENARAHFNNLYWRVAVPSFAVPLITGAVVSGLTISPVGNNISEYISIGGFAISGLIAGWSSIARYQDRKASHAETSTRFADLASDIEGHLVLDRRFRSPADRCLIRTELALDGIGKVAPPVPSHIAK